MVTVGQVLRPQHNRGEVVVLPATDFPDERFAPGSVLHMERDGTVVALTVSTARPHDARWVVGFDGVTSIDDAERLRGHELRVPATALRPLAPGAYYIHDLVGCEVWTEAGALVGRVVRVDGGTGVPLIVVASDGDEVLVPFVDEFCRRVDLEARRLVITPPPGLLDVNRTGAS